MQQSTPSDEELLPGEEELKTEYTPTDGYDFSVITDTWTRFNTPEEWVCESMCFFLHMISLQMPEEFKVECFSDEQKAHRCIQGLRNARIRLEQIKAGRSIYSPAEHVYSPEAWFEEGVLDFLFQPQFTTTLPSRWDNGSDTKNKEMMMDARIKACGMVIEKIKEEQEKTK